MTYKGYTARVEFDPDDRCFHGVVLDINDVVHFEGTSVDELEQAFHEAVDDYLSFCEEQGLEPERPFSGRLNLRMAPELHRQIHVRSAQEGVSINEWITKAMEARLHAVVEKK